MLNWDSSSGLSCVVAAVAVMAAVVCVVVISCIGCAVAGSLAWVADKAPWRCFGRIGTYYASVPNPAPSQDEATRAKRLCDLDGLARQVLGSDPSAARWAVARLDVTVSGVQSWVEAWVRLQKGYTRAQPRLA